MANCKTNGHIYRQFSTRCVMCGEEGTDFEKCSPPCEYYDTGKCRCAQMEGPVPALKSLRPLRLRAPAYVSTE